MQKTSGSKVEEVDTATAIRAIHSKLTAAAPPSKPGAVSGAQIAQTLQHVCKTEDLDADSFSNLVW
jgi:hypothetical protein